MKQLLLFWDWCKINWKFLLGISIPIVISILMRRGNAAKIYKAAAETRKKELEISKVVHELEEKKKRIALELHDEKVEKIISDHDEALEKANDNHLRLVSDIDSAEEATQAIKDRLK